MKHLFVTEEEREHLIHGWNATDMDYPDSATVPGLFERHAAKTPDAIAVVAQDGQLDYAELNRRANRVAHHLIALGVGAGKQVVIHLDRTSAVAAAVLGVLKAGATYVPADAQQPLSRLTYALSDVAVAAVLTERSLVERLPETTSPVIVLDDPIGGPEHDPGVEIALGSTACIVYTSGSTGVPKGVQLSHANLAGMYFGWENVYQLKTRVRSHCQMMNFSFVVFQADLVRALCSGGKLVLCPLETVLDPADLYRTMIREEVDFAEFVPAVLRNLVRYLEDTGRLLDFLHIVVVGSDRWHYGEHSALAGYCGQDTRVVHSFGLTEACVDSAWFEHTDEPITQGQLTPIGKPFPNVRLYVLDEDGEPVPVGVEGELYIGGIGVTQGYRNNADETAARFVPDPFGAGTLYRTGDLARRLADGNVQFLGRGDAQIKVRGFRVEPGEIELALREHPGVRDAVVMSAPGPDGADRLVACVVPVRQSLTELGRHHTMRLPSGIEVVSLNDSETLQFHQEIFRDELYTRNGVTIEAGDCVFDVGANIGMFSLYAHGCAEGVAIHAFEPSPEVFRALSLNLAVHELNARLYDCALSRAPGEAELTYYPNHAGMSTLYGNLAEEKTVLGTIMANQYRQGSEADDDEFDSDLDDEMEGWLDERLHAVTHKVQSRTLSDVFAESGAEHVDLLKVVVQKSESDVLAGIADTDWPKIRQLVIEVYDLDGRVEKLRSFLANKGFHIAVEQAPLFQGAPVHLMYAVRQDGERPARSGEHRQLAAPVVSANSLHEHLRARLADYMVPRGFVFLEKLPLTSTGKIDRGALPLDDALDLSATADFVAPRDEVEQTLADIWTELLGVAEVGVHDDFYGLGGHSLMATRVLSRIRRVWSVEVPMRTFLRVRTVEQLAQEVRAIIGTGAKSEPSVVSRADRDIYRRASRT